jgi:hypothetical protein
MASKPMDVPKNLQLGYASPAQDGDTSDTEPAPKRRRLQPYPTIPVNWEFTAGSFRRFKKFFNPEKRTVWCTQKYRPVQIPKNATLVEAKELLYNLITAIGSFVFFAYFDISAKTIERYLKLEKLEGLMRVEGYEKDRSFTYYVEKVWITNYEQRMHTQCRDGCDKVVEKMLSENIYPGGAATKDELLEIWRAEHRWGLKMGCFVRIEWRRYEAL